MTADLDRGDPPGTAIHLKIGIALRARSNVITVLTVASLLLQVIGAFTVVAQDAERTIEVSADLDWVKVDGYQFWLAYPSEGAARHLEEDYKAFELDDGRKATVVACDPGIEAAVGTAHGNHSYGAVCRVDVSGTVEQMAICNDEMVGWNTVQSLSAPMDARHLAEFVGQNCVGG